MNGYRPSSGGLGSHGPSDNGSYTGAQSSTARPMPHINDLKARAEERLRNAPLTVDRMLEAAEQSAKQIDSLLDFRRPDFAYLEYIIASELVFNRIPTCRDAPLVKEDRGTRYQRHRALGKFLSERADRLSNIKEIIINDNKRSGVRPTIHTNGVAETHSRHASVPAASTTPEPSAYPNPRFSMRDELFLDTGTNASGQSPRESLDTGSDGLSGRSTPLSSVESPRTRPPVNPKPQNMHGRALQQNGSPSGLSSQGDALSERFARLRASGNPPPPRPASIQMPSPLDFNGMYPGASLKPQGPRAMPSGSSLPERPPKLPLDTRMTAFLPKEPSPAPPRTTVRSLVRTNSIPTSSLSAQAPNGDPESYFPTPSSQQSSVIRRKSLHAPREWQISAEKLFDYLKPYNVLVVDVRAREDYDDGHIYVNSIMCIEPAALRPNMSADQLQEALVLSPDIEQEMFDRRNEFDLVVYYDQSTPNADFLTKSSRNPQESALKYLYDALYEFNADKPLQRPPILLMGGLDAWADLLGQGALKTSNTAAIVSDQQTGRRSRPLSRAPMASNGSRLYLQKKRMRDYNPLDPEEEKRWLEKARGERPPTVPPHDDEEDGVADEETPYYHSTEEFMRRFPDASAIGPQSMTMAAPRPPPVAPSSRPSSRPPSRPPPAVPDYPGTAMPSIPSRPPPTASRVNYSGAHDRNAPQNHVATARSSQLPTYLPASQLPQNIRLPRTGLVNFGVTCYMNATIQCLNATLPLTRIYKDGSFVKYIQKQNWRGSQGTMSENYATLIQNLWVEGGGPVRPKTLRELCARINQEWGLDRQQDAKEFLDFLLDVLHEDMNVNWSHPPAQALTDQEEARRESLPKAYVARIEWMRWSMRERSIVSELFGGQHMSRLRCTTCHFTSTTFETFYSISIEIPRSGRADIRDCLRSYCSEERLSGDEVWRCPRCKKEREATKQITITRAPHYLVFHFKRFSASHTERARKVCTPIEFPLNNFDISPFMLPPITPEEETTLLKQRPSDGPEQLKQIKTDERMTPPYMYNAYAVMRHLGQTLTSGHYIAMLKDAARGCWWQFNDTSVTSFQPEALRGGDRLQNEQAYIVFYERDRLFGR
ncbi:ubiquitin carboxyl-terminal hydrolase 2 [Macrophomina phaseolina]|uniref:Ubiquitin carboxyl-terminal hydrolase 2 n=1 Tax=Macrophomina phaseolina TaxID=35725 RepID=A0ABQ8GI14_9PEZI|nr:ubiquitin carboxyl-terminal hydrolase 2 [Macrophomina phaseolina]